MSVTTLKNGPSEDHMGPRGSAKFFVQLTALDLMIASDCPSTSFPPGWTSRIITEKWKLIYGVLHCCMQGNSTIICRLSWFVFFHADLPGREWKRRTADTQRLSAADKKGGSRVTPAGRASGRRCECVMRASMHAGGPHMFFSSSLLFSVHGLPRLQR